MDSSQLDAQLSAIGHPVRRAILDLTMQRERSAGELADAFKISRPAVSQHIHVLVAARFLRERREAQRRLYSVDAMALARFRRAFDELWSDGLARLKEVVEAQEPRGRLRGKKRG